MSSAALTCDTVSVTYGSFKALTDVSVSFKRGRLSAIIGPNGAGKTTFLNVLTGIVLPTHGRVLFGDRDITRLNVERRALIGIGRSFQTVNIFPEMTVEENLRLAAQRRLFRFQPFFRPVTSYTTLAAAVAEVLPLVRLAPYAGVEAGKLSHGNQRALELGLTIIGQPDIILLDEPLAGIGRDEIVPTMELLRSIARSRTMILVEHNMDVVMNLADDILVLVGGRVLKRGTPTEVRSDPAVKEAYLGR